MIHNANLYEPNNYSSKTLLRTHVKENFSDLTNDIFDYIDENKQIDSELFSTLTKLHPDFFEEYCEQMKAAFEPSRSKLSSKKANIDIYLTFNGQYYKMSKGLSAKSHITISTITMDEIGERDTVHDVEKTRIKIMFS